MSAGPPPPNPTLNALSLEEETNLVMKQIMDQFKMDPEAFEQNVRILVAQNIQTQREEEENKQEELKEVNKNIIKAQSETINLIKPVLLHFSPNWAQDLSKLISDFLLLTDGHILFSRTWLKNDTTVLSTPLLFRPIYNIILHEILRFICDFEPGGPNDRQGAAFYIAGDQGIGKTSLMLILMSTLSHRSLGFHYDKGFKDGKRQDFQSSKPEEKTFRFRKFGDDRSGLNEILIHIYDDSPPPATIKPNHVHLIFTSPDPLRLPIPDKKKTISPEQNRTAKSKHKPKPLCHIFRLPTFSLAEDAVAMVGCTPTVPFAVLSPEDMQLRKKHQQILLDIEREKEEIAWNMSFQTEREPISSRNAAIKELLLPFCDVIKDLSTRWNDFETEFQSCILGKTIKDKTEEQKLALKYLFPKPEQSEPVNQEGQVTPEPIDSGDTAHRKQKSNKASQKAKRTPPSTPNSTSTSTSTPQPDHFNQTPPPFNQPGHITLQTDVTASTVTDSNEEPTPSVLTAAKLRSDIEARLEPKSEGAPVSEDPKPNETKDTANKDTKQKRKDDPEKLAICISLCDLLFESREMPERERIIAVVDWLMKQLEVHSKRSQEQAEFIKGFIRFLVLFEWDQSNQKDQDAQNAEATTNGESDQKEGGEGEHELKDTNIPVTGTDLQEEGKDHVPEQVEATTNGEKGQEEEGKDTVIEKPKTAEEHEQERQRVLTEKLFETAKSYDPPSPDVDGEIQEFSELIKEVKLTDQQTPPSPEDLTKLTARLVRLKKLLEELDIYEDANRQNVRDEVTRVSDRVGEDDETRRDKLFKSLIDMLITPPPPYDSKKHLLQSLFVLPDEDVKSADISLRNNLSELLTQSRDPRNQHPLDFIVNELIQYLRYSQIDTTPPSSAESDKAFDESKMARIACDFLMTIVNPPIAPVDPAHETANHSLNSGNPPLDTVETRLQRVQSQIEQVRDRLTFMSLMDAFFFIARDMNILVTPHSVLKGLSERPKQPPEDLNIERMKVYYGNLSDDGLRDWIKNATATLLPLVDTAGQLEAVTSKIQNNLDNVITQFNDHHPPSKSSVDHSSDSPQTKKKEEVKTGINRQFNDNHPPSTSSIDHSSDSPQPKKEEEVKTGINRQFNDNHPPSTSSIDHSSDSPQPKKEEEVKTGINRQFNDNHPPSTSSIDHSSDSPQPKKEEEVKTGINRQFNDNHPPSTSSIDPSSDSPLPEKEEEVKTVINRQWLAIVRSVMNTILYLIDAGTPRSKILGKYGGLRDLLTTVYKSNKHHLLRVANQLLDQNCEEPKSDYVNDLTVFSTHFHAQKPLSLLELPRTLQLAPVSQDRLERMSIALFARNLLCFLQLETGFPFDDECYLTEFYSTYLQQDNPGDIVHRSFVDFMNSTNLLSQKHFGLTPDNFTDFLKTEHPTIQTDPTPLLELRKISPLGSLMETMIKPDAPDPKQPFKNIMTRQYGVHLLLWASTDLLLKATDAMTSQKPRTETTQHPLNVARASIFGPSPRWLTSTDARTNRGLSFLWNGVMENDTVDVLTKVADSNHSRIMEFNTGRIFFEQTMDATWDDITALIPLLPDYRIKEKRPSLLRSVYSLIFKKTAIAIAKMERQIPFVALSSFVEQIIQSEVISALARLMTQTDYNTFRNSQAKVGFTLPPYVEEPLVCISFLLNCPTQISFSMTTTSFTERHFYHPNPTIFQSRFPILETRATKVTTMSMLTFPKLSNKSVHGTKFPQTLSSTERGSTDFYAEDLQEVKKAFPGLDSLIVSRGSDATSETIFMPIQATSSKSHALVEDGIILIQQLLFQAMCHLEPSEPIVAMFNYATTQENPKFPSRTGILGFHVVSSYLKFDENTQTNMSSILRHRDRPLVWNPSESRPTMTTRFIINTLLHNVKQYPAFSETLNPWKTTLLDLTKLTDQTYFLTFRWQLFYNDLKTKSPDLFAEDDLIRSTMQELYRVGVSPNDLGESMEDRIKTFSSFLLFTAISCRRNELLDPTTTTTFREDDDSFVTLVRSIVGTTDSQSLVDILTSLTGQASTMDQSMRDEQLKQLDSLYRENRMQTRLYPVYSVMTNTAMKRLRNPVQEYLSVFQSQEDGGVFRVPTRNNLSAILHCGTVLLDHISPIPPHPVTPSPTTDNSSTPTPHSQNVSLSLPQSRTFGIPLHSFVLAKYGFSDSIPALCELSQEFAIKEATDVSPSPLNQWNPRRVVIDPSLFPSNISLKRSLSLFTTFIHRLFDNPFIPVTTSPSTEFMERQHYNTVVFTQLQKIITTLQAFKEKKDAKLKNELNQQEKQTDDGIQNNPHQQEKQTDDGIQNNPHQQEKQTDDGILKKVDQLSTILAGQRTSSVISLLPEIRQYYRKFKLEDAEETDVQAAIKEIESIEAIRQQQPTLMFVKAGNDLFHPSSVDPEIVDPTTQNPKIIVDRETKAPLFPIPFSTGYKVGELREEMKLIYEPLTELQPDHFKALRPTLSHSQAGPNKDPKKNTSSKTTGEAKARAIVGSTILEIGKTSMTPLFVFVVDEDLPDHESLPMSLQLDVRNADVRCGVMQQRSFADVLWILFLTRISREVMALPLNTSMNKTDFTGSVIPFISLVLRDAKYLTLTNKDNRSEIFKALISIATTENLHNLERFPSIGIELLVSAYPHVEEDIEAIPLSRLLMMCSAQPKGETRLDTLINHPSPTVGLVALFRWFEFLSSNVKECGFKVAIKNGGFTEDKICANLLRAFYLIIELDHKDKQPLVKKLCDTIGEILDVARHLLYKKMPEKTLSVLSALALKLSDSSEYLFKQLRKGSNEASHYSDIKNHYPSLLPYIPRYFGTRFSNDHQFLMLENLTFPFKRPCVIDIKVGTKEVYKGMTEEKKLKHFQHIKFTTQESLGLRLVGVKISASQYNTAFSASKRIGRFLSTRDKLRAALAFCLSTGEKSNEVLDQYISSDPSISLRGSPEVRYNMINTTSSQTFTPLHSPPLSTSNQSLSSHSTSYNSSGDAGWPIRRGVVKSILRQIESIIPVAKKSPYLFSSSSLMIAFDADDDGFIHDEAISPRDLPDSAHETPDPPRPLFKDKLKQGSDNVVVRLIDFQHVMVKEGIRGRKGDDSENDGIAIDPATQLASFCAYTIIQNELTANVRSIESNHRAIMTHANTLINSNESLFSAHAEINSTVEDIITSMNVTHRFLKQKLNPVVTITQPHFKTQKKTYHFTPPPTKPSLSASLSQSWIIDTPPTIMHLPPPEPPTLTPSAEIPKSQHTTSNSSLFHYFHLPPPPPPTNAVTYLSPPTPPPPFTPPMEPTRSSRSSSFIQGLRGQKRNTDIIPFVPITAQQRSASVMLSTKRKRRKRIVDPNCRYGVHDHAVSERLERQSMNYVSAGHNWLMASDQSRQQFSSLLWSSMSDPSTIPTLSSVTPHQNTISSKISLNHPLSSHIPTIDTNDTSILSVSVKRPNIPLSSQIHVFFSAHDQAWFHHVRLKEQKEAFRERQQELANLIEMEKEGERTRYQRRQQKLEQRGRQSDGSWKSKYTISFEATQLIFEQRKMLFSRQIVQKTLKSKSSSGVINISRLSPSEKALLQEKSDLAWMLSHPAPNHPNQFMFKTWEQFIAAVHQKRFPAPRQLPPPPPIRSDQHNHPSIKPAIVALLAPSPPSTTPTTQGARVRRVVTGGLLMSSQMDIGKEWNRRSDITKQKEERKKNTPQAPKINKKMTLKQKKEAKAKGKTRTVTHLPLAPTQEEREKMENMIKMDVEKREREKEEEEERRRRGVEEMRSVKGSLIQHFFLKMEQQT
ncbi:hypothetical protein BLNAU_14228 [Blattamonas nauphoetae]|uniref:Kinase n=1 Tax=Blattamonas nauphoetae TaxID=2049346 RepID=A0ABQ9XH98_9EUKA|nr:hypothetical protein BLNAU_14228 [Blattamonas nauphoetae]